MLAAICDTAKLNSWARKPGSSELMNAPIRSWSAVCRLAARTADRQPQRVAALQLISASRSSRQGRVQRIAIAARQLEQIRAALQHRRRCRLHSARRALTVPAAVAARPGHDDRVQPPELIDQPYDHAWPVASPVGR